MSYRQAKEIVLRRHPLATLKTIRTVKPKASRNRNDSILLDYSISVGDQSLSGPDLHRSIAQAWIAAANIIQPPHDKPKPEPKVKQWPLWERDHKKRIKREGQRRVRMATSRPTGKVLAE